MAPCPFENLGRTLVEVYCTLREQSIQRLQVKFWRFTYFISGRPREFHSATVALTASIHAICVLPHQLASRQQVYTMHSIQPAQHLHSRVKTKNHSLLRHRGLKTEDLTFTTWCRETNVTNGVRWHDEITWFITQSFTLDVKYCLWSPDGSTENIERTVDRKLGGAPAILGWNDRQKRGICLHCPL